MISVQAQIDPALTDMLEKRMLQKELSRIHDLEFLFSTHGNFNAAEHASSDLGNGSKCTGDTLEDAIEELRRITLG